MLTQSDEEFFLQSFIFTGLPFFGNQMLSHVIRRISAVVAYQFESESKKIVFSVHHLNPLDSEFRQQQNIQQNFVHEYVSL